MSHKPDPNKSVSLTIDGIPVTVPEGTRILEAAKKVNVYIPTLCEHPDLCKRAFCRICVVEADGRGKLIAACANDVWEGVKIETNNRRLLDVRKTILELILANHPQDCLSCIRNKKCELQTLANVLCVRASPFDRVSMSKPQTIEGETFVRDMEKCVKCGRCVEVCHEVQTIGAINTSGRSHNFEISVPYKQSLEDTPCVFCGRCASVCPVGAIYEHDQSAKVLAELFSGDRHLIAQVSGGMASAMDKEFGLAAGTITVGKLIAAIKLLKFKKVFNEKLAANLSDAETGGELEERAKNGGKLPLISGSSDGVFRFVNYFYPDLTDHLSAGKSPEKTFANLIKNIYAGAEGLAASVITTVSFVPTIAQKYKSGENNFVLAAGELARMIKLAGLDTGALSEEQFDSIKLPNSYKAESPACAAQKKIVSGFAEARKVMEAIRKGECTDKWVEIKG
ncbi:MAG: (2Fe-2S)-binding protein [Treponema sp.]|jgi:ferredoxin|nr:(2Fe-2S)-binding protein [Treponema sp.]